MLRRSRSSSFSLYSFASSPFFATSSQLKKERYNLMALTTRKIRASVPAHEKATHTPLLPSSRKYIWLALNYLLMSLLAIFFLFPIVFMIISSLKADENQLLEDVTTLRAFIPYGDLSLQNYNDAFQRFPFGLYLFNSLVIVTCIVTLGLLVNSLMAYALARITFPGSMAQPPGLIATRYRLFPLLLTPSPFSSSTSSSSTFQRTSRKQLSLTEPAIYASTGS